MKDWRKLKEGSVYLVEFKGTFTGMYGGDKPFEDSELYILHRGFLVHAWSMTDFVCEQRKPRIRSVKELLAKYRRDAVELRVIKDFDAVATKVGSL